MYMTADKDMKATTLVAYELGYRTKLFNRFNMDVNLFCHDYGDYLTEMPMLGPPGLLQRQVRNGADIVTYGLEWEGRYAVNDKLTLLGNYTLDLTEWLGPDTADNAEIMIAPKNKFMVGARYNPWQDLHLSAHMYYVDSTTAPDPVDIFQARNISSYIRLDLRAEYDFWKNRASAAVGVRNLLDPNHPGGQHALPQHRRSAAHGLRRSADQAELTVHC